MLGSSDPVREEGVLPMWLGGLKPFMDAGNRWKSEVISCWCGCRGGPSSAVLRWELTSKRRARKSCKMIRENEIELQSESLQERSLLYQRWLPKQLLPMSTSVGKRGLVTDSSVVWQTKVCLTRCS